MKIGTMKGEKLLIGNHLDKSFYLANQEHVLDYAMSFVGLALLRQGYCV
jgi:hypothetical protein